MQSTLFNMYEFYLTWDKEKLNVFTNFMQDIRSRPKQKLSVLKTQEGKLCIGIGHQPIVQLDNL